MKKLTLSIAAIAAMGTFAVAGGDIAPVVEEPVAPVVDVSGFYMGIGYAASSADFDNFVIGGAAQDANLETDESAGVFIAGYQYNEYLSFEARWTHYLTEGDLSVGTNTISFDVDGDNIGLYIKPQYSFNNITAYGLLGYGWTDYKASLSIGGTDYKVSDVDGDFQWGLGLSYALSEHTSIFVDYTQLHNGGSFSDTVSGTPVSFDSDLSTWNFGMTYKF